MFRNDDYSCKIHVFIIFYDSGKSFEKIVVRVSYLQELTQVQLAEKLGISQSSVSARQKRAYYDEIMELELLYRELINKKLKA